MSLFYFQKRKDETDSLQVLWKIFMIQIIARPFFKTCGFWCTVNFDFANLYLQGLVDDF